jgi:hypothetical protein
MARLDEEVVISFKTEGGDLVSESFKRAGAAGDQFHSKVAKVNQGLGDLRLKSEARVAHNIGAIAQSFTSGASAGQLLADSISRVAESFRGSVIFAGAALAGYAIYEGLTRAGDAAIKFHAEIDALRRPQGSADFLGLDAINKKLSDASSKLSEIRERDVRESSGAAGALVKAGRYAEGIALGYGGPAAQDLKAAEEKAAVRKSASAAIDDLAQKTRNLNKVEFERITVGERQAELDKADIEHKERLGALAEAQKGSGVQNQSALHAENTRAANEKAVINAKFAVLDSELRMENELAGISRLRSTGALSSAQAVLYTKKLELAQAKDLLAYYEKIGDVDKTRSQKTAVTRAQTDFNDTQYGQWVQARTDPGWSYRQQQEKFGRTQFDMAKKDYQDRIRRGAYGQTGPDADVFGKTTAPESFSGLKSLDALQFKGAQALDAMDFSGLSPLNGFSISIQ